MKLWRPPVLPFRGPRDSPWEWAGPGAAQAAALDVRYSPPQGRPRSTPAPPPPPPPWTAPMRCRAPSAGRRAGAQPRPVPAQRAPAPLASLTSVTSMHIPGPSPRIPDRSPHARLVSEQPAQRKPELISISKTFFLSPKLGVPPSFSLPAEPVGMKRCPFLPLGLPHCMGHLENKQFQCLSF